MVWTRTDNSITTTPKKKSQTETPKEEANDEDHAMRREGADSEVQGRCLEEER